MFCRASNFKFIWFVFLKAAIIILGGVPIIVIIPPKILAKAKGIKIILGERFCFVAVLRATGSINASAPTLFIIAEQIVATPLRLAIWVDWLFDNGAIFLDIKSTTPEFLSAWLIISTKATVITAGWPNPMNRFEELRIRFDFSPPRTKSVINKVDKEIIETISYLNLPHINKAKVNTIIQNIAIWSNDIETKFNTIK